MGPGGDLLRPDFAEDGSEEPEIAGVYLIDADGSPVRLGYCLANEFSDHVVERGNYLWLAHSKLRTAAIGPELLTDGSYDRALAALPPTSIPDPPPQEPSMGDDDPDLDRWWAELREHHWTTPAA